MRSGHVRKWLDISRALFREFRLVQLRRKARADVYARASTHLLRDVGLEPMQFDPDSGNSRDAHECHRRPPYV